MTMTTYSNPTPPVLGYSWGSVFKKMVVLKLTVILFLATCFQLNAKTFGQNITLSAKNASLEKVLNEIKKQSGYAVLYRDQLLQKSRPVDINVTNASLEKVLDMVFKNQPLTFEIIGNKIITLKEKPAQAASNVTEQPVVAISISGTVTNEKGEPMEGVTVSAPGASTTAVTDAGGNFSMTVPENTVELTFSYVGYQSITRTANSNNAVLNISLQPLQTSLEDVVVVGYGTQKRTKVTGAISSVPMKEIQDMPVSNVASAMQGKVAGVVIQQNSGEPGSTPAIKVRGFGSINAGNGPLIVVDGNIVSSEVFALLNANDIESMDVLKDASSSAIYGSRGANGIVMVTTKRGKSGKTKIDLDIYTGVQQVSKEMDVLNSEQFAEFGKEASNNAYIDNVPGASASDPNSARPSSFLRYRYPRGEVIDWFDFDDAAKIANMPSYDFQDMIFRSGMMSNYQLSFSGGSEKVRYAVSGGYLDQEGIMLGSDLKRYTLRANIDADISSRVRVGMNIIPTYRVRNEVNAAGHWASNGIINAALSAVPMAPVYAADGVTYSSQTELAPAYNYPGVTNPLANITEYHSKLLSTNVLANAYAEIKILNELTYRASGNVSFNTNRRDAYRTSRMPLNQILPPTVATGSTFSDQGVSWLFNQTLNYTKTFNYDHSFSALIGMESNKYNYYSSNAGGSSYPNDLVETLNASASGTTTTASSSIVENATISYFARLNYSFKNKYIVNVSVRRDGSSIFGPDQRWGTFPAASVGWRIKEENFLQDVDVLSDLKLRASYGLSGNNAFSSFYPYAALLQSDNYAFNNTLANGLRVSSPENRTLSWEKNAQFDIGLDVGLFSNRLYITADYYNRITKDLLLSVNVPTITGFSTVVQNIGEMENKGWEFAITSRNFTGEFSWNTSANLSFNRNKVLALGPTGDPIRSGSGVGETNITLIGEPIGSFFGYKQKGIFLNQAELDKFPHDVTSKPGDVMYEDINNDNRINADDRTIIGNNQPDFIFGFANSFSYKGFDLSIAIQGSQGGEILNLSRRFFENLEGSQNQLTTVLNRWRSESDPGDGKTPRANARTAGNNNAVSSRWVEDGSYVRIQNITLGYNLASGLLNKAHLRQVRIYVSAQNLYTWSDYLGYNPEVSNYESALTGGVDYGSFPLAKTFTIGINIGL